MKILVLLGLLFSFSSYAQTVKTEGGCSINHPLIALNGKAIPAPAKAIWTGGCSNGKASGYGYYGFSESKRVHDFIYLNAANGDTSAGFALLYGLEGEAVFEAFIDLKSGAEVDGGYCRSNSVCKKVFAEAEKNQGMPPELTLPPYSQLPAAKPPVPPAVPPSAPPVPPKAPTTCTVEHPTDLVWQRPDKSIWTGACSQSKPHGYGWYKFDLSKDGYPQSRVEILIEFNQGAVANSFYYAKMFTQDQVTYEGFAQLGGYQVDNGNCLALEECARTADVLKNGVKSPVPVPPKGPAVPVPPPAAPQPPEQEPQHQQQDDLNPPFRSVDDAQEKFEIAARKARAYLLQKLEETDEQGNKNTYKLDTITSGMIDFERNFPEYAYNICQRNRVVLEGCRIFQYETAVRSLINLVNGADVTEVLFPTANYRSLSESCHGDSMSELRNCWSQKIDGLERNIAARHPNGTKYAVLAFAGYATAISYLNAYGGSAYSDEFLGNYEKLIFYLHEQANTAWRN